MQPWVIVPLPDACEPAAVFAPVAGESPLVRVLRSVSGVTAPARIVVASTGAHSAVVVTALRDAGLGAVQTALAAGAASRSEVITAGLKELAVQRNSRDPVLLCDCRHPLAPKALAGRVAAALAAGGHDVVVPTLAVTDTVKTIDARGFVLATVDRTTLRSVQFPRGFAASALWNLVAATTADADDDEFDAALRAGLDVATVAGDPLAAQVELPRHAALLEAVIANGRR